MNALSRRLPTSLFASTGRQRCGVRSQPQLDLKPPLSTAFPHASSNHHLIAATHSLLPLPRHPATTTTQPPESLEQSP